MSRTKIDVRRGRLVLVLAAAVTPLWCADLAQAATRRYWTSGPNKPWPNVLFADDYQPYDANNTLEPDDAGDGGFSSTGYATPGQQVHNFSNSSFYSALGGTPANNTPTGAIYSQIVVPGASNDYGTGTTYLPSPQQASGMFNNTPGVVSNALKLQGTPTVAGNVRAIATGITAPGGSTPFTNTNIVFSGKVSVDWAPGVVSTAAAGSYRNDIQLQNTNAQTVLALRASRLGEVTPGKITLRAYTGNGGTTLISDWSGIDIDPNQFYRVEMAANYTGTINNFALEVSLNGVKVADNIPFVTGGASQTGYAWLGFQNPDATPGTGQVDAPKFGLYDNFEWRSSNSLVWNSDADNANWTGLTWRHGQLFTVSGVPNTAWNYGGVPNASFDRAVFRDSITGPRTVNVDSAVTVQHLQLDNAVNSYTLAGPGSITVGGARWVTSGIGNDIRVVGTHTISAGLILGKNATINVETAASQLNLTGTLTATGRNLTKVGAGALQVRYVRANALAVNAGSLKLTGDGTNTGTSSVTSLSVATGASLDITANRVIVDYTGTSPLVDLATAVSDGRISSSYVASGNAAIGVIEASQLGSATTFGGQPIDGTAVLLKYTLRGDANLDSTVNFDDLLSLAANYNTTSLGLTAWGKGDFNYDGSVNFDDLLSLAANYNTTFSGSFAGDWALAQSAVPEPTTMGLIASGCVASLARRRRRRAMSTSA